MAIGIILGMFGMGALFVLLRLAAYALPTFVAVASGLSAYNSSAGVFGAIMVGIIAGAATLSGGKVLFGATRSNLLRVLIALVFAVPAAMAGYSITLALSQIGGHSEPWAQIFAAVSAATIGIIAAARLAAHCGNKSAVPDQIDELTIPNRSRL